MKTSNFLFLILDTPFHSSCKNVCYPRDSETMTVQSTPTDADVVAYADSVRSGTSLGAGKVLQRLRQERPEWSISEKRLRKLLNPSPTEAGLVPKTGIDPSLNVNDLAPKVTVRIFEHGKGKGLVCKEAILKGEVVWQEEPWIATADS